jgi:transposase
MLSLPAGTKVFVSLTPIDMRKSINGLSALILDVFAKSPQSRHLFLFHNKARDKVKLIFWDRNGFVLYYKRLERGRFKFSKTIDNETIEIAENQLQWLLAGLDFQLMHEFNELSYSEYY